MVNKVIRVGKHDLKIYSNGLRRKTKQVVYAVVYSYIGKYQSESQSANINFSGHKQKEPAHMKNLAFNYRTLTTSNTVITL